MDSFDYIADGTIEPTGWMEEAALKRKDVRDSESLTPLRTQFIKEHAIAKDTEHKNEAKKLDTWRRGYESDLDELCLNTCEFNKDEALKAYPQYSARLLIHFKLIAPLLTRDDDPFYLFDNPVRKDHIFNSAYLSAASVKGLSADAYQRAFPPPSGQIKDSQAYRSQDAYALRLFGIADDGAQSDEHNTQHQRGRLRFSPVWFRQVQFLVMNPQDPKIAKGTIPIQMEAIASGQTGCIEVIYFNPRGCEHSDERTVRHDLARWLAAVSSWWPVLGLGGKRLAGYGQIDIESVVLQAVDWSGMPVTDAKQAKEAEKPAEPPPNYEQYLDADGQLIDTEQSQARAAQKQAELEQEIAELDQQRRHATGKAQSKAIKAWEKAKKKRDTQVQQWQTGYAKAQAYWQDYGSVTQTASAVAEVVLPIGEKKLTGADSGLAMAQWMAEI